MILPTAALYQDLLKQVPELRSVCIVLDWHGDINKAVPPCFWLDERGRITEAQATRDAVMGSMQQLMRTLEHQANIGLRVIEAYDVTIQQKQELLANVEKQLNEQSERFDKLAEAGQSAAGQLSGQAGQGRDAG